MRATPLLVAAFIAPGCSFALAQASGGAAGSVGAAGGGVAAGGPAAGLSAVLGRSNSVISLEFEAALTGRPHDFAHPLSFRRMHRASISRLISGHCSANIAAVPFGRGAKP